MIPQKLQRFSDYLLYGFTQASEGNFNDQNPDFEKTLQYFTRQNNLPNVPRFLNQVHGKTIIKMESDAEKSREGDALITKQIGLPLMVKTADCQGVIIYAPDTHSLAVIHSGWRGSVQNIIGETVEQMTEAYGCHPERMHVAISPSLGPCCARFTDPKKELPEFCHSFIDGNHVDFWALSLQQCQKAGIPKDQIEIVQHCTQCKPVYFSHRRGESGRNMTWAMLKA